MSTYITQIEKHRFVCGLFWQSLSRPRELLKEAADLARKIDSDLMILRKDHATAQAGFAHTKDGARRTTYSLAAAVSKTLALEGATYDGEKQPVHNWLGAFKLPDGMWAYFAVRDANFLPNGDFSGTKEEVIERLHGDYSLGGWNVVIGDAELEAHGFHNFSAKRIEELLPRRKNGQIRIHKWWGLRPVERTLPWRAVAAFATLVAVLAIGGGAYWKQVQHKREEEQRARAIEVARQMKLGKAAPSTKPHPWLSLPSPLAATQACLTKFSYMTAGGWSLEDFVCTNNRVNYSWARQGSTIEYLLAQVPGAVVDMSGEKATYSASLPVESGTDEALLDSSKLLQPLISRLQLMNVSTRIAKIATPIPKPAPQKSLTNLATNEEAPPDWQTYSFSLKAGGLPPSEAAMILSQPGVRLSKLAYHGGAWLIEGVMYAK